MVYFFRKNMNVVAIVDLSRPTARTVKVITIKYMCVLVEEVCLDVLYACSECG